MRIDPATALPDGSLRISLETAEFIRMAVTQIERALYAMLDIGAERAPLSGDNTAELELTRALLAAVGHPGRGSMGQSVTLGPAVVRLLRRAGQDLTIALTLGHSRRLHSGRITDFREEYMLAAELGHIAAVPREPEQQPAGRPAERSVSHFA